MKRLYTQLVIFLLISACQESITVYLEKEPGAVTGIVHPKDVQATIGLYQEVLIAETTSNPDGSFRLEDVSPGTYLLRISADGYGTRTIKNITVDDGVTTFVGEFVLTRLPWPVRSVKPANGATDESKYTSIVILFHTDIVDGTAAGAFSISPVVDNLEFDIAYVSGGDKLRITGDFKFGTTYTFTLDTTLNTHYEQPLEFPLTSSFTTVPFQVEYVVLPTGNSSPLEIRFNASVSDEQVLSHIISTPETGIRLSTSRDRRYYPVEKEQTQARIFPTLAWRPGITTITLSGELAEAGSATLGADTSFAFEMDSLAVISTRPYDGQHFVSTAARVYITFNTIVNEGTIENAISLTPPQVLEFHTYSHNYTSLTIMPDTLLNSTTYTVVVDTSLRDIWGGWMKSPYSFTFATQ